MLVEREIKELANKKEYNKIFNYFHAEYTQVLKDFLIRNDVKINESDCLINYIIKTRAFMPEYSKYTGWSETEIVYFPSLDESSVAFPLIS